MASKKTKSATHFQVKMTLIGSEPEIWRRVVVGATTTLEELNDLIQIVMGWENCHLHHFNINGQLYGPRDEEFDEKVKNEASIDLTTLVRKRVRRFVYEYDFGDGWVHELRIEKRIPAGPALSYPSCIAGARACPPEDSGGLLGFYDKLATLNDVGDERHRDIKEWMGDFDPDYLDIDLINQQLVDWASSSFDEESFNSAADEDLLDYFMATCGWCENEIDEDSPAFQQGVKFASEESVSPSEEGLKFLEVSGREEPLLGFVTPEGSEAKKAGSDLVFHLCSKTCAEKLRAALRRDLDSIGRLGGKSLD